MPNRTPRAADDVAITHVDTPVAIMVLANDGALYIPSVGGYDAISARGGQVSCTAEGTCTHSRLAVVVGVDSFAYTASDVSDVMHSAVVTIEVVARRANGPSDARDDVIAIYVGDAVQIDVLANDGDPEGDGLAITDYAPTSVDGGQVNCTGAGLCSYTPARTFMGPDRFRYTADDGHGGTDGATVTVQVATKPANRPLVANDDVVTITVTLGSTGPTGGTAGALFTVLSNDYDPDGDAPVLSSIITATLKSGLERCATNGTCTYIPFKRFSGTERFDYVATDGYGHNVGATVELAVVAAGGWTAGRDPGRAWKEAWATGTPKQIR